MLCDLHLRIRLGIVLMRVLTLNHQQKWPGMMLLLFMFCVHIIALPLTKTHHKVQTLKWMEGPHSSSSQLVQADDWTDYSAKELCYYLDYYNAYLDNFNGYDDKSGYYKDTVASVNVLVDQLTSDGVQCDKIEESDDMWHGAEDRVVETQAQRKEEGQVNSMTYARRLQAQVSDLLAVNYDPEFYGRFNTSESRSDPFSKDVHIHIIGERNSGTKFMTSLIGKCFRGIRVEASLYRWKHWFQPIQFDPTKEFVGHPIILQTRNPYNWIEGMKRMPWHWPKHGKMGAQLKWFDFVTKPLTTRGVTSLGSNHSCGDNFKENTVVPCSNQKENAMFYELDINGIPFENIFEFRAKKMLHFLRIPGIIQVRYEDELMAVKVDGDLSIILDEISAKLSETMSAQDAKYECFDLNRLDKGKAQKNLSKEFHNYITEHIDWEVEDLLGYAPRTWVETVKPGKPMLTLEPAAEPDPSVAH